MNKKVSNFCIYTIMHPDKFTRTTFEERKLWVTGRQLWRDATESDNAMLVLIGNSTACSRLLFWGVLTDIRLQANKTRFSVDRLGKIPGNHSPQELILRSTGKRIAPRYIKPYAICRTPDFVTVR